MRRHFAYFLCFVCALGAVVSTAAEDSPSLQIPRQQHVWGKFPRGSWKRVRLVTETVDDQGRRTSATVTETKSTLDKVEDSGVTLRVETTVEVEGKRFESPVQTVRQNFNGQIVGQPVAMQSLGGEILTIDNKQFPCQVWQVQTGPPEGRRNSRVFYSSLVSPYVLRREITWTEPSRPGATNETVSEVIAVDMPYRVLDEVHSTAFEKLVYKAPQSTTTTVSVTSPEVPGGVVAYTSKEVDAQGRLVRRATLELVDYGIEGDDNHPSQVSKRTLRRERVRGKNGR